MTVTSFMRFARYYAQVAKTGKSQKDAAAKEEDAVQMDKQKLRSVAVRLAKAMDASQAAQGQPLTMGKNMLSDWNTRWCLLLSARKNTRSNGKIDIHDFVHSVQFCLNPKDITEAELKGWYRSLGLDAAGPVLPEEFALAVYRSEVDHWPLLPEVQVGSCVAVLNNAAHQWHFKGTNRSHLLTYGSWFKILSAQGGRGTEGHIHQSFAERTDCCSARTSLDYNEFVGLVRNQYPGLNIQPRDFTDNEVKGVWKCIDVDRLGRVKFGEFLQFMRVHTEAEAQGLCGGRLLARSANQGLNKLQKKELAAALPESASKMAGYPTAPRTAAERQRSEAAAEIINSERRKNWNPTAVGSTSGVLRQDDALRNVFIPSRGGYHIANLQCPRITSSHEALTR